MTNNTTLLETKDLSISLGRVELIQNGNLSLETNSCNILLGNNGSGKTSLFRALLGFLKPSKGKVFINEHDTQLMSADERAKVICYVPQRLEYLPDINCKEFLETCIGLTSLSKLDSSSSRAIENAISLCKLENISKRSLQVISSGELRRVLIASAFLDDYPLVLLDEPTSNLDPASHALVLELISMLVARKSTVFFSTHNLQEDLRDYDKLIAIYDRTINIVGQKNSRITSTTLADIYKIPIAVFKGKNGVSYFSFN